VFGKNQNRFKGENVLSEHLLVEGSDWKPRDIRTLNEDEKSLLADKLVTKLFNDIKNKALDVDFSVPEHTKGDIHKLKEYKTITDGIRFIDSLIINDKDADMQIRETVNALKGTITILEKYREKFMTGFRTSNMLLVYLYDSLVISLIEGTSIVISEAIEVTTDQLGIYKAQIKKDRKKPLMSNNYINALLKVNDMESNGKLGASITNALRKNESVLSISLGIFGGFILLLSIIRGVVYMYFHTRVMIAKKLETVKTLLEMNLVTINGRDAKVIKSKQEKWVKRLGELSEKINIDSSQSQSKSSSDLEHNNKEIVNDIKNDGYGNSIGTDILI